MSGRRCGCLRLGFGRAAGRGCGASGTCGCCGRRRCTRAGAAAAAATTTDQ